MTRRPRIRSLVEWDEPAAAGSLSPSDGIWGALMVALDLALDAGLQRGLAAVFTVDLNHRRLPKDPTKALRFGNVLVMSGTAPWMPTTSWADRPQLRSSSESAWVQRGGLGGTLPLDLSDVRIVSLGPNRGTTVVGADCAARLVGAGVDVRVVGPWIAFAWLGHLGGWPDPQVVSLDDEAVAP